MWCTITAKGRDVEALKELDSDAFRLFDFIRKVEESIESGGELGKMFLEADAARVVVNDDGRVIFHRDRLLALMEKVQNKES